jgi:glycosyltransferase involved in cell wall biosynthesis
MSQTLSAMGFETHVFFIGDPDLEGHESTENGKLHLHRWCQWISRYHPQGVYDGEEDKLADWNQSLPDWIESQVLSVAVEAGNPVVILGEEWQTTRSMILLHDIVVRRGWEDKVHLIWNANNTFSFWRIDWDSLKRAVTITTVSRYMKHVMWEFGVNPWVFPNGIPERWIQGDYHQGSKAISRLMENRLGLVKVARWDPDKRWDMAVDATAEMKRLGMRPLLVARGGNGQHGDDVVARANRAGLVVALVAQTGQKVDTLVAATLPAIAADVIVLSSYLSEPQRQALFHAADAVLANSGVEPFGLVGLETMAVGGVAFVGCTGEDYATPGYDAVSLQTSDPSEIVHYTMHLHRSGRATHLLRQAARRSALRYTWQSVIDRNLMPLLEQLVGRVVPK